VHLKIRHFASHADFTTLQHKCCCTRIKSKNTKQTTNKVQTNLPIFGASGLLLLLLLLSKNGIFDRENDKGAVLKLTKHADQ